MLSMLHSAFNYRLLREIASGGMGIVYEAQQLGAEGFSKTVAIKLIREEFSAIKLFRDNFVGEALLVADLIHTNIVQIYHLGIVQERYFMAMEYVQGMNLEEFLELHRMRGRPVPVEWAVFIVSRVCRGLAYAHSKMDPCGRSLGIVHRDVTPRNILISLEGDVKLTDFGIAKALDLMYNKEGEVIAGHDAYLSPEQARKEVTDGRADLFSCGIILAELLLGHNCFEAQSGELTRNHILQLPLPEFSALRLDIDAPLEKILQKVLERPRSRRYATAYEFLSVLEDYLYHDHYGPTNEKFAQYISSLAGKVSG